MMKAYFISSLQPSCQEGTNLILLVGKLAQRRKVIVWIGPERKCQKPLQFLCSFHSPYMAAFSGEGETAHTQSSETGNGIGVGRLLADVRFLTGGKRLHC